MCDVPAVFERIKHTNYIGDQILSIAKRLKKVNCGVNNKQNSLKDAKPQTDMVVLLHK